MNTQIEQIYRYALKYNWKIKQSWWQKLKGKITGRYEISLTGDDPAAFYRWRREGVIGLLRITLPVDDQNCYRAIELKRKTFLF